jgi:hypothetical protein
VSDESVRVLVVGLPLLLYEMLEAACAPDPSIEFVGRRPAASDLKSEVDSTGADCVVVALDDGELPSSCRKLLAEQARVRLLGVSEKHGHTYLYRLRPDVAAIGDVAPQEIARAIRLIGDAEPGTFSEAAQA